MPANGARPWDAVAPPDLPPVEPCGLVAVDDALVTAFRRGPTRSVAGPRRWMTGAVHDARGRLVVESQRVWAGDPAAPVAVDPVGLTGPADPPRLEGTWLYAGHWTGHFGHFFVETLTNLWPRLEHLDVRGLLAHRSHRGDVGPPGRRGGLVAADLAPWQAGLVELAGHGGRAVQVVRGRPIRVERLVVPERPVVLKSWVRPEAVDLWRRMAAAVAPAPAARVFLSRSLFHRQHHGDELKVRVSADWDAELDRVLAAAGFEVVHPETLPVREQVAVARAASVLAGSQGSALHLSAFAAAGTPVLEIGDQRSPREPLPAQQAIDAACEHVGAFAPYGDLAALRRLLEECPR